MAPKISSAAVICCFVVYAMLLSTTSAEEHIKKIKVFDTVVEVPKECRDLVARAMTKGVSESSYCPEMPKSIPQADIDNHVQTMQSKGFPLKIKKSSYVDTRFKAEHCSVEERRNCCKKHAVHQPYFAVSEGTLKMVIQSKFFQQTIKVTQCLENSSCFTDFNLESLGFKTQCKTDYATTKLYVYNSEKQTTESVPVTFPVSCSCSVSNARIRNEDYKGNSINFNFNFDE